VTVGTSFQYHAGAATRALGLDRPIDLRFVLGALVRGAGDPTIRVAAGAAIRASVTLDGPGTIEIRVDGPEVRAWAWGPGAGLLLDGLPAVLGADDDDSGFDPAHHPLVAALARRRGRVLLGRTGAVWEALLPAVLEQRITGTARSCAVSRAKPRGTRPWAHRLAPPAAVERAPRRSRQPSGHSPASASGRPPR